MRRSHLWLSLLLLPPIAAPHSRAAETPKALKAPSAAPEPEPLDLPHQLEKLAAGKALPVAVVADAAQLRQPRPLLSVTGKPLRDALGDMAEAFSDPTPKDLPEIFTADTNRNRKVFEPYAFRAGSASLWTIAPDRRWEDRPPQETGDILAQMPDFELSGMFQRSLTAAQLKSATTSGLRWSDLTDRQKPVWKALLARPFAVYRIEPKSDREDNQIYVASSQDPLPVENVVLHLYIGFENLTAPTGRPVPPNMYEGVPPEAIPTGGPKVGEPNLQAYVLRERDLLLRLVRREMPWRPQPVPIYDPKMKPGDLDFTSASLSAPIGVAGVMPLAKAIAAAAAVTKLPLKVDARLGQRSAYIGDAALRTGDTLRLLTFSFDGAWRKVSPVYLLTWDRKGKAALQQEGPLQSGKSVASRFNDWRAVEREIEVKDWDALVMKTVGPDPALPLAPTVDQWQALDIPPLDASLEAQYDAIYARLDQVFRFEALDPSQQDLLRRSFENRRTHPDSVPPNAPFPVSALEKSRLNKPTLLIYVDIPGVGRVNATRVLRSLHPFDPTRKATHAIEIRMVERDLAARKKAAEVPVAMDYPTRAVAPPPLARGEWTRLLEQMQRKGLDTVYVPVLWDGQALFPSEHFPLLPVCRGEDILSHVLAQAKPRHIRVVAVLHTLAWRFPKSGVHWLDKRPELLDVDAAGRTRRQWAEAHPLSPEDISNGNGEPARRLFMPLEVADAVPPTVSEVRARLVGFARDLTRYRGLDGIALDHWTRANGPVTFDDADSATGHAMPSDIGPDLGYTLPERSSFLEKHGVDPVDLDAFDWVGEEPEPESPDYYRMWRERGLIEDTELAKAMLNVLQRAFSNRVQLFSTMADGKNIHPPAASVVINMEAEAPKGVKAYRRVMPPTIPVPEVRFEGEDLEVHPAEVTGTEAKAKRLEAFQMLLAGTNPLALSSLAAEPEVPARADGIVLDFTGSPDLLWDALALLPNRGKIQDSGVRIQLRSRSVQQEG